MEPKYKLDKKPRNWKDLRAGWHRWIITYQCVECHKNRNEPLHGTEEGIKEYLNNPVNLVCEKCLKKI